MVLLIDGFNLMYKFPDLEEKMLLGQLNEAQPQFVNEPLGSHPRKP